ncbi:hypothetical protein AMR41_14290, partial [Hapalosiphon sp. MRB220]
GNSPTVSASWLSPEFHAYVLETFKRYLEGDVNLAVEILERAKPSDVAKSKERIEGTHSRDKALQHKETGIIPVYKLLTSGVL